MGRKKLFTDIDLTAAIVATRANFHLCATKLNVDRSAIIQRVAKSEAIKSLVEDIREGSLDIAETKLDQLIMEGNLGAICFKLKTQGRKRNYIERQEVDLASQNQLTVKTVAVADLTSLTSEQLRDLISIARAATPTPAVAVDT